MKRTILKLIVVLVTIGILYEGYGMIKEFAKSNQVEDIKTIDIFDNKDKTLSIMLQEDGINFTEAKDRTAWPDIKKYTYDKSECVDSTGEVIDYKSILTFNYDSTSPTVTIKTKNTVYCTLYFVKGRDTLKLLQDKGKTTFIEKSGMYRFVGTASQVLNNYICFGTTDSTVCKAEPDKYMYRIIGMTKNADTDLGLDANRLKIIKATPLWTSRSWELSEFDRNKWENSRMKSYLTEYYNETFINEGQDRIQDGPYWDGLITGQNWYMEKVETYPYPSTNPLPNTSNEGLSSGKIGLMYASDYYNSWTYAENTNSWLFLANGWSGNPTNKDEWTMSRYPVGNSYGWEWQVRQQGYLMYGRVSSSGAVRPVYYLKSDIMLSGDGSTTDPFRIAG